MAISRLRDRFVILLSLLTVVFYLAASAWVATGLIRQEPPVSTQKYYLFPGFAGLVSHAFLLYTSLQVGLDLILDFFNSSSLMCWFIIFFLLVVSIKEPVENLAMLFLPFASVVVILAAYLPGQHLSPRDFDLSMGLHVILSIAAYSLLTISALQAVVLAIQERQLRKKEGMHILNILPPLKVMEDLLFGMITTGFFCLSLSLVSGFMFIDDLFAQHLVHKTVLSVTAWVVFAVLLWGRWTRGWRGIKAIRWTLAGFFILMLAYFGTKLVLEIILQRV